jgi:hypothetical protein
MNTTVHNTCDDAVSVACSVDGGTGSKSRNTEHATQVPTVSPRLFCAFSAYSRWYVARHFHSLRVSRSGTIPNPGGLPLVIYANHAA